MIDLRSDVLGPVHEAALHAMFAAASSERGFSLREDPQERALEEEVSAAFGFGDGLFVPTGTMANQIALRLWCAPGEIVIADRGAHVAVNEAASTAALNGVALRLLEGIRGHLSPDLVAAALAPRSRSPEMRRVALVWLENTHNRAGGTIMPGAWADEIAASCHAERVSVHIDGARIWNAVVASGESMERIASKADSMSVNLNKAIGAPAGSLLLGSRDFIKEAARVRKLFGGWWGPVGMIAAAALAATRDFRQRLANDHGRARRFAALLAPAQQYWTAPHM